MTLIKIKCTRCNGTGVISDKKVSYPCAMCDGGYVEQENEVEIEDVKPETINKRRGRPKKDERTG
jgi:DnaJ-class molecular chaperone